MSGIIGGAGSKSGVIGETEIDYEEGTWTPTLTIGGSSTGITYSISPQSGTYTKIGRQVTLNGYMTLTSDGSLSGGFLLQGLPFTCGAGEANYSYSQIYMVGGNLVANYASVGFFVHIDQTNCQLTVNKVDGTTENLHQSNSITSAADIQLGPWQLTYFTS